MHTSKANLPTKNELLHLLRYLTPQEIERLDALLSNGVPSFRQFASAVKPDFVWYKHCAVGADVLQRVADGELKRVMFFEPPRHGKSELTTRLFPAYYLYRYPHRWVAIGAHTADFAYGFSRNARDYFTRYGGSIRQNVQATAHWETEQGGGLWAAGIGGAVVGKGFHLGVIDDPIKSSEEAFSEAIRRRNNDWIDMVWSTREEPDCAQVFTMQRWTPDDLAGYLLSKCEVQEEDGVESDGWHIVNFEAIKSDEKFEVPPNCTVEEDWREIGEALCPERYSVSALKRKRRNMGAFSFNAMYQQRPISKGERMFDRAMFTEIMEVEPAGIVTAVRYWDKAGTEGGSGAESAGVLMARLENGKWIILDVVHGRWQAYNREVVIKQTAALDAAKYKDYYIYIEKEGGSGGKESAEQSIASLSQYAVFADTVTGDKVVRARPFAAQCQARNVVLLKGSWNEDYLRQLEAFPHAKMKDMVDASSGAYNKLSALY